MAIIKVKFDRAVEGASNIVDTGTEGTKVATGTTAQRGSTAGQLRFNTTTGLAEYYTGSEFKTIDTPPIITSVDVTNIETDLGGTQTFVITGTGFNSGATVKFRDNGGTLITPDTTTVNSDTQITVTKNRSSFSNANEPYDIIVTNLSGLSATLDDQINVDNSPVWNTASGSLGTIVEDVAISTPLQATATDPDGDTVSYSETGGTVISSTLGLTLNSSTGQITGTPNVNDAYSASGVTHNFTLRATANGQTSDRAFSILRKFADGTTSSGAVDHVSQIYSLGITTNGDYYININGTPTLVYCDLDGTYTGDSSNGYMLYQSFGSTDWISSNAISGTSITSSNYGSYGWTSSGSSTYETTDRIEFFSTGSTDSNFNTNSALALGGISVSNFAIKFGHEYDQGGSRLFVNESQVGFLGPTNSTAVITGSINTSGTTPLIRVFEGDGVSISSIYYIFLR